MSAHKFVYDGGYGCDVCGARYHCSACNDGSGMMGHYVPAADAYSCQESDKVREALKRIFK